MSTDPPEKNAQFRAKFDFPYDLLSDTDARMALAYGAVDEAPAKAARRISYLIGPDGKVRKAYATVKAADHPAQVLADV